MKKIITNAILFNIGWIACVAGGDKIALLTGLVILTIHFLWVNKDPQEWRIIFTVMSIGIIIDSIWFYSGLMKNADHSLLIPVWLIVLWVIFATTINNCLRWLHGRPALGALVGLIFGPFAYWMGANISTVVIKEPLIQSMLLIGFGWMLMLPSFFILTRRIRSVE